MVTWNYHPATARMITDALPQGMVRKSMSTFEWDISGRCEKPVSVTLHARPSADWIQRLRYVVIKRGTKSSLIVELQTPCRKCRPCHIARRRMWVARAMHEVRESTRTWFGTMTFSPQAHYVMQCRAIAYAASRSIPTEELTADELLERQAHECAKELTLWLKRVRKKLKLPGSMRYLLVRERHEGERITEDNTGPHVTGYSHWHALIHESGEVPIPYRALRDTWAHGHVKFKLVEQGDERAAYYVAGYLQSAEGSRVRPSIRYGRYKHDRNKSSDIASVAQREMEASQAQLKTASQRSVALNGMRASEASLSAQSLHDLCEQEAKADGV